jgi:hypothetical protein
MLLARVLMIAMPVAAIALTTAAAVGAGPSLADQLREASSASDAATTADATTSTFDRNRPGLPSVAIQACKVQNGPTGAGHVTITFAGSGAPSSVVLDTPRFAGPVGDCILAKFRAVRVPPYDGGSVRVGKSFAIN